MNNNTKLELSPDVYFNPISKDGFIVCNDKHDHYYKINKQTYNLLLLIDGKRTINEVCEVYNKEFDSDVKVETLISLFKENISQYGTFIGYDDVIKPYQKPTYLKLSFIIINKKVLSKIVKWFYPLFKKQVAWFVVSITFLIVFSLLLTNIDLYKSFDLQQSILFFFIIMATSVTFHEIGHATSASYFGAKHGGIGGGFYLFTPVYFADVTDIWRLSKKQRIIVNLAGMYFELIFCSIVALIGFFFENYTLLVISLFVCLHTLFNLNPFVRSDGYWILSDLADKPNLLQHSIKKVNELFKAIYGRSLISWRLSDYLLLIYGLCSFIFIGFFLYYVLLKNPNSILLFPKNVYDFYVNLINGVEFTLAKYGELIIPLIFYYFLYNLLKVAVKKGVKKIRLATKYKRNAG